MIFNRYELISIIIKDNQLSECDRSFIANFPDEVLFKSFGKKQFKAIRKGYYTLNT